MTVLQSFIAAHLFVWYLVFTRIGAAFMVMPVIGESFVPVRVRLLLALIVSVLVAPLLQNQMPAEPSSPLGLFSLLASEILIGVFIGSIPRLLFGSFEVAGMIIAMQSGLSNAFVFNPSLSSQGSLPGSVLAWLGLLLIFVSDLHHLLILAILHSYELFRPGSPLPTEDFYHMVLDLVSQSFMIGVEMSAPFLVTGLLLALVLGIMSRLSPQMQVFMVFMSAQVGYGLFLFAVTLAAMLKFWLGHFDSTLNEFLTNG